MLSFKHGLSGAHLKEGLQALLVLMQDWLAAIDSFAQLRAQGFALLCLPENSIVLMQFLLGRRDLLVLDFYWLLSLHKFQRSISCQRVLFTRIEEICVGRLEGHDVLGQKHFDTELFILTSCLLCVLDLAWSERIHVHFLNNFYCVEVLFSTNLTYLQTN